MISPIPVSRVLKSENDSFRNQHQIAQTKNIGNILIKTIGLNTPKHNALVRSKDSFLLPEILNDRTKNILYIPIYDRT